MTYLLYYLLRNFFYVLIALIIAAVLLNTFSSLRLFKKIQFLIISSGSMRPSLGIGDLSVLVTQPKDFKKNDVISFKDPNGSGFFITHRIKKISQEEEKVMIKTKGDANTHFDEWALEPKDLSGKIIFSFPWVGYVVAFTKTFTGFLVLILIPSVMLIANELAKIKIYLNRTD